MSAPQPRLLAAPTLADLAFASLAPAGNIDAAEARWLEQRAAEAAVSEGQAMAAFARWQASPPIQDRRLASLAATLSLSVAEVVAVSLSCAVETDLMAARVLAWLQAPVGGARPTAGLIAKIAGSFGELSALAALAAGTGRACGLLRIDDDTRPLPEATITLPQPVMLALDDAPRLFWPGLQIGLAHPIALPPSIRAAAAARARVLGHTAGRAFVVRSGHPREAQAVAGQIAAELNARPVFLDGGDVPAGLGPWLWLSAAIPVFCLELAPGERRRMNPIPGWYGPLLIATGPDGSVEFQGESAPGWRVPIPNADERVALWQAAVGDDRLATQLGEQHRHAAGRIAELGRAAQFEAQLNGATAVKLDAVAQAARGGATGDLGSLAELMPEGIPDAALVLTPSLRGELGALADRCLARDVIADGLGPAMRARFRPGVRALFVGPSGTGKSLAVGWLATRLGLPLYRVDLASVTSKYIGETEKNLAQLFARAEHSEVILMFDEADSLFGKRTDVKDSNDRFANAQTNYLLSRIESYEGIAVLTSNSRARFDSAFTRRLDAIIEFPAPGPEERRALWQAHLGADHALDTAALNRLAAGCELAGGHIRNVVLAAAVSARAAGREIGWSDLAAGVVAEYRKLGKQAPHGLSGGGHA